MLLPESSVAFQPATPCMIPTHLPGAAIQDPGPSVRSVRRRCSTLWVAELERLRSGPASVSGQLGCGPGSALSHQGKGCTVRWLLPSPARAVRNEGPHWLALHAPLPCQTVL